MLCTDTRKDKPIIAIDQTLSVTAPIMPHSNQPSNQPIVNQYIPPSPMNGHSYDNQNYQMYNRQTYQTIEKPMNRFSINNIPQYQNSSGYQQQISQIPMNPNVYNNSSHKYNNYYLNNAPQPPQQQQQPSINVNCRRNSCHTSHTSCTFCRYSLANYNASAYTSSSVTTNNCNTMPQQQYLVNTTGQNYPINPINQNNHHPINPMQQSIRPIQSFP